MRAAPTRLIGGAVLTAALIAASPAAAATITSDGSTVTYTAAAGERNSVLVTTSPYDTSCGSVGAPCLNVWDSGAHITAASGACVVTASDPITGDSATCSIPTTVVANLGDRDDAFWDWDGPSIVDGGGGNDIPITGSGGDDVLRGGIGDDLLEGWDGNDLLDGGPGDDSLEGVPGGFVEEGMTVGADTYVGGGGYDSVTYEGRTEDLALSPDGAANDGASGEGDDVGTDVMQVIGGRGADVMTGSSARNVFGGLNGDDELTGGGGDDQLSGGTGADRVIGGDGQDVLGGEDGDDLLVGGAGVDRFYGDSIGACLAISCESGRDDIRARDGEREEINCGAGTDATELDPVDVVFDSVSLADQCEGVLGTPAGPAQGGSRTFGVASAKVDRRHRIRVRLNVPGPGTARVRATAPGLRVGGAARKVSRAGAVTLTVKPARAARRALRRYGKLRVTLRVRFQPQAGAASTVSRRVTLRRS